MAGAILIQRREREKGAGFSFVAREMHSGRDVKRQSFAHQNEDQTHAIADLQSE